MERSKGLHRFALVTAGATWLLLIAGGLVTSTGSGLAVPDWPLSFGKWMPPMIGGVLYEHGHRMIASTVGLLTLVLALWMIFREPRTGVRRLAIAALAAVVLQGLLGGATVLYKLPHEVSIAHACLAEAFFGIVVAIAALTSLRWTSEAGTGSSAKLRALSIVSLLAVYGQIALGAVVRHTGGSVPYHVVGAMVAMVMLMWTASVAVQEDSQARRSALAALGLAMAQIALGFAALTVRVDKGTALAARTDPQIVLATAHLAVGALIFAACVVLVLRAFRAKAPATTPEPALALEEARA